jgi:hypothetical protein
MMIDTLRADGIKLSLEMTLILIRSSSSELDPNARFLKLMGENRINLPFLCNASRDATTSGTYCILSEDTPRAKRVIAGDATLAACLDDLPSVGSISVFPHNFNLAFLGSMLRLMGQSGAPLYGLATSISVLTMITDFCRLEQTAAHLARHVSLPRNHSPFNPDIRIKSM